MFKRQYLAGLFLLMSVTMASCAPQVTPPTQAVVPVTATPTLGQPSETATVLPPTETPAPIPAGWPVYKLAAKLPEAPAQARLYTQDFPATLPTGERLAALTKKLQITGTVSVSFGEDGSEMLFVTGGPADLRMQSDDPLIMVIDNLSKAPANSTPAKTFPPEVRVQTAKTFLEARNLLDFPYLMEPPSLSREKDQAIRVVPLLDGIPLHDTDPLNGRLLVTFDSAGEISAVFWRPLKLTAGDEVAIIPAAQAWEQLVSGKAPKKDGVGQCWQAQVFDPLEPYGVAGILDFESACASSGGSALTYAEATISDVKLVYFAHDLSNGMSPFAFPADSPARTVFPIWQFTGTTSDNRELIVLWPAMAGK